MNVAFLTIGQSPRHDMADPIEESLPAGTTVVHSGLLDGLSRPEIEAAYGDGGAGQGLITRLADGSSVTMRVEAVEEGLRTKVASLTDGGVDAIVLLCTGEFPSLRSGDVWLIEPDTVLTGYVVSLFAQVRVGMILPMAGQVDDARVKWRGLADPIFAFASPYSDDVEALVAAAYDLVDAGARALVLDCMGFNRRHREALRARGVEVPVLVANEVVGGVVRIAFS
ncbi:MAG TPA: AroM family protein [Dermatophilaceae bacterium]|jgi:protein AroM|nr:AroM family protein [Dermatophilaceae bacterium]HOA90069.1 AroM family protein [Propioniciclava tarda]HQD02770.1 AroM family protein [Dermatophilaceae bacterium]